MNNAQKFDFLIADYLKTDPLRNQINRLYHTDEGELVKQLLEAVRLDDKARGRVNKTARDLISQVRARKHEQGVLEAFMQQYDLSSAEGVVLMCLAEALLRIPDNETAEKLIADKLTGADWESHLGLSSSILVNAGTWGLMLTGKLVELGSKTRKSIGSTIGRLVNRSGEPMVRAAIRQSMKIMAFQFVMGRNIDEAMDRAEKKKHRRYRYSFDMLGEAALTAPDAERYFEAYQSAIKTIGSRSNSTDIFSAPSISVKLSALHPRYEFSQRGRVIKELTPKVTELARLAKANHIALTIDAEEADRLLLALDIFALVLKDRLLAGWDGFGIVVQAYQKMACGAIDLLASLARETGHRIPVRLVKGAYWDTEIKHAQVEGYPGYPVFTRKANSDVSYIACAQRLLDDRQAFYPQFASHNANSIAAVAELAGDRLDFEFQRLHGMGKDLYAEMLKADKGRTCRVYAPVGNHEDLLPYLVRRLLENGANTSFVNRIMDEKLPLEKVAEDPLEKVANTTPVAHPSIPLPVNIYAAERRNSSGINLVNESLQASLATDMQSFAFIQNKVEPLLAIRPGSSSAINITFDPDPAYPDIVVAEVRNATEKEVDEAIAVAVGFCYEWDTSSVEERANVLEKAADTLEQRLPEFMALCAREAGKTVNDAISEVREAVDFCRYYAVRGREQFGPAQVLHGPTGEHNELSLHGRGVFVCISPWNFPLAIFMGQVTAALVAGNTVLAKPAEQTPLIAYRAVQILHEAGIPRAALQFLPGDGATIGARLTSDPRIDGVAFTGSTETARQINLALAGRDAPLAALIAETGGQNVMIVDSSALPEQVVSAVISSAFLSAGQRCSALRVLYLQENVAEKIENMLAGAMQELVVGDPRLLNTDVGPVIDSQALAILEAHTAQMESEGRLIARVPMDAELKGHFFAPCAYAIESIEQLQREVFGPVLHVIRYRARDLDVVLDEVYGTGYGLTLGVHSRIDKTQQHVARRARVGNCYINRTMTGAVVGVQPFGGERLSGTGAKAGGPHYLHRFATERTLTINTAAVGGNAGLLDLDG
jgi:RHH-type proline utilization regulon transcriptional repressor/proline dehydrogenase/delta 1-pyrroline-5-carboxylate dehydrogenase